MGKNINKSDICRQSSNWLCNLTGTSPNYCGSKDIPCDCEMINSAQGTWKSAWSQQQWRFQKLISLPLPQNSVLSGNLWLPQGIAQCPFEDSWPSHSGKPEVKSTACNSSLWLPHVSCTPLLMKLPTGLGIAVCMVKCSHGFLSSVGHLGLDASYLIWRVG